MRTRALAVALALAAAAPARADTDGKAIAVAAGPGLFVHGAGHYVAGERRTARRLLYAELIGLAVASAGGLAIGASGGAEETVPALYLIVPGGAVLITSWLADIYGAATGGRDAAAREAAPVALEAGWGYVHDTTFARSHLATLRAELALAPVRVTGAAWAGDGAWRAEARTAIAVWRAGPGTFVEVALTVAEERDDDAHLAIRAAEVAAAGRYDLAGFAPTLRGSFVSLALGGGAERVRYEVGARPSDTTSLMVGRFGFGVYLDDGEVELFYDHRRDRLAGGLVTDGGVNGFVGSIGVDAIVHRGAWGLAGGVEVGSAWVFRLAARHRFGGPR